MLNRWSHTIHRNKFVNRITKRLSEYRYQKISERWWDFCRNQCNRIYWDKFPEEYKHEIEGIADGVNAKGGILHGRAIDYKDILALNEMYEFLSKLSSLRMGIHPLKTLIHYLKRVDPEMESMGALDFVKGFINDDPPHHCNGFIATGDATTEGQIVFSHSMVCGGAGWWWNYYISLRWNVILDIKPSQGNRVIMPSSPGLIWSDEDYYQNDNGIVLLETTVPQGPFDNRNLPLCVRARKAMQYGNSIDDVVYHLRYRNDGCMNAVWLIGDSKTGEIARLDLGYTAYALLRTFNGFYWSANNPLDIKVRREKFNPSLNFLFEKLLWILQRNRLFAFSAIKYIPSNRDIKYEELGNKYYGEIDIDIVKEIMFNPVIVGASTDTKVTDSKLLEKNGLWAFYGNPIKLFNYTNLDTKEDETISVHPVGWVKLYGLPAKQDFNLISQEKYFGKQTDVIWKYDTKIRDNDFYSSSNIEDGILYTTTSEGKMYAFNINNGQKIWEKSIGLKPTNPVIKDDMIFVGHSEGLSAYNTRGAQKWEVSTVDVISNPIIIDDTVIFSDNVEKVYALSAEHGVEKWKLKFSDESYLSTAYNDKIYITSGEKCYASDLKDHKISWNYTTNGTITSAPILMNNMVYFGSWDNYVYALDAKNGKIKWRYETGWGIDTAPEVSDDQVFIGCTDNNLYALNAKNGELNWLFTCNAAIHSSPVAYGDYVFFGSDDGRFYALNKTTGESEWFFAPRFTIDDDLYNYITTPILSDPVVYNGTVYIGANGDIYALDAQTFEQQNLKITGENIPYETWLFIILSLLIVVLITAFYLYISKKRVK